MPDDLSTLLSECRRLRRERDDLAKMCRRLAEELAAATFKPREIPTCDCEDCRRLAIEIRLADEAFALERARAEEAGCPEECPQPCPCGSPAVTVRPTLRGESEPACGACAAIDGETT